MWTISIIYKRLANLILDPNFYPEMIMSHTFSWDCPFITFFLIYQYSVYCIIMKFMLCRCLKNHEVQKAIYFRINFFITYYENTENLWYIIKKSNVDDKCLLTLWGFGTGLSSLYTYDSYMTVLLQYIWSLHV
jgi:hypothetical protein